MNQLKKFRTNVYKENLLIGNRIPKDYFITKGSGESNISIHSGSFHLALKAAGIERTNILTYSSILPAIARKISRPKSQNIVHGSVMESIMAVASIEKGERATAGIGYAWLYDKRSKEKFGGLVCEHQGDFSEEGIRKYLKLSLAELYENGFEEDFDMPEEEVSYISESIVARKKYGTALAAICFTSYVYPILT